MHSYKTRDAYQEHVLHMVTWARDHHGVCTLANLDARAEALVTHSLSERIAANKSPSTLQSEQNAFRLFFSNRKLAGDVTLPRRTRAGITQNCGTPKSAAHFQPTHYPDPHPLLRGNGTAPR